MQDFRPSLSLSFKGMDNWYLFGYRPVRDIEMQQNDANVFICEAQFCCISQKDRARWQACMLSKDLLLQALIN